MSKQSDKNTTDQSRRQFIGGLAAAGGGALLSACGAGEGGMPDEAGASTLPAAQNLPAPEDSGIDHIVVVMMENRSYDHVLGWVPGSDGVQQGLRYPSKTGELISSFHLASHEDYGYQGCGYEDPSHSYKNGRVHYNNGGMDGFLLSVDDANVDFDHFPVGYYTADDLPFFAQVAQRYTICDRYFSGVLASTYPNRVYLHAGQTDRLNNTLPYAEQEPSSLPTIWDRMAGAGVDARYYFNNLPTVALWGEKYLTQSTHYAQFALDCAAGLLPSVSFVDPWFQDIIGPDVSNDDHPHSDIRDGQVFLNDIYNALRSAPTWERTLMVVVYDEWGGFYDHVTPPVAPVSDAEAELGNDGRLGFRVPCILIGPRAGVGQVAKQQYDVNSVLNMICWRYDMEPLGVRGRSSANLATALDFSNRPSTEATDFAIASTHYGVNCETLPNIPGVKSSARSQAAVARSAAEHQAGIDYLRGMALRAGFKLPY